MELVRHLARVEPAARAPVIACGSFDGVHRGHQALLARLAALAQSRHAAAVVALWRSDARAAVLTNLRQQLALLAEQGVDRVVLLGPLDPHDSCALATRLGAGAVVTAADSATASGWALERVNRVADGESILTAATIRGWLGAGDLAAVERALGRNYAVEGRVVHGFHRGAALGIPTANLHVRRFALPPDGVYAVRARRRGGAVLDGVANVGRNPTFANAVRSVETHLFEFGGDLYGQRLEVAFIARLRGEQKFAGVDALVAQIRIDIDTARAALASHRDEH